MGDTALTEAAEEVVGIGIDHEVGYLVLYFSNDLVELVLRTCGEELLD